MTREHILHMRPSFASRNPADGVWPNVKMACDFGIWQAAKKHPLNLSDRIFGELGAAMRLATKLRSMNLFVLAIFPGTRPIQIIRSIVRSYSILVGGVAFAVWRWGIKSRANSPVYSDGECLCAAPQIHAQIPFVTTNKFENPGAGTNLAKVRYFVLRKPFNYSPSFALTHGQNITKYCASEKSNLRYRQNKTLWNGK